MPGVRVYGEGFSFCVPEGFSGPLDHQFTYRDCKLHLSTAKANLEQLEQRLCHVLSTAACEQDAVQSIVRRWKNQHGLAALLATWNHYKAKQTRFVAHGWIRSRDEVLLSVFGQSSRRTWLRFTIERLLDSGRIHSESEVTEGRRGSEHTVSWNRIADFQFLLDRRWQPPWQFTLASVDGRSTLAVRTREPSESIENQDEPLLKASGEAEVVNGLHSRRLTRSVPGTGPDITEAWCQVPHQHVPIWIMGRTIAADATQMLTALNELRQSVVYQENL